METDKKVNKFLNPLELQYKKDNTLQFNNLYTTTSQGYRSFFNEILKNTRDHTINNYSMYYLTDNKKLSDFINIKDDVINDNYHIVTYIKNNNLYLSISDVSLGVQLTEEPVNYFEICFNNKETCYIKTFINNVIVEAGDKIGNIYYISANNNEISVTDDIKNKCDFNYIINDNNLYLFVNNEKINSKGVVSVSSDLKLIISSQLSSLTNSETFIIDNNQQKNINYNTSFGVYENRTLDIDKNKSLYDLSNNILITSQYSYLDGNNIEVDLIVLKNQITPRGYLTKTNINASQNYREYTSLFTGSNQETGNSLISLNYNYFLTDLQIKPGINTFTTPSSLSPYHSSININDIDFQSSGSFGYINPSLADKIYRINDNGLIKSYAWLSCNDLNDKGIWLSRYYNSSLTNVQNISSTPAKIVHNITDIDKIFYENNEIVSDGYIDIISDLKIEPSTTYIYKRITNREINNFNNHNTNLVMSSLKLLDTNNAIIYDNEIVDNIYTFNNERYAVLPIKNYMYNNQLSLSFYLNSTDYTKVIGDQILGNLNCYGFALKRNFVITPMPMISFTGGVSFGVVDDLWNMINGTAGETQYKDHDTWSSYKYEWNRFLYKGDINVTGNYIFNTDLKLIDILPTADTFLRTVRVEHTDFYYAIYANQILRMTPIGVEMVSFDYMDETTTKNEQLKYVNYDENNIYCIGDKGNIYELSIDSETLTTIKSFTDKPFNTTFKHDNKYYVAETLSGISEYNPKYGIFFDKLTIEDEEKSGKIYHAIYHFNPDSVTSKYNYLDNNNSSRFFIAKSIQDFKIIDNYIGVIYNDSKFNIYNTDRDLLYSYDFSIDKKRPIAFDYVGEITPEGYKNYFIILTADKVFDKYGREITKLKSDNPDEETLRKNPFDYVSLYKLENFQLELINTTSYTAHNLQSNETRLTNYSLIKRLHEKYNDYYIKYKLTNKYNSKIDTRIINLPTFDNGDNHMVINFNSINGQIEIYKNAKLIASDTFETGKYVLESIFDENMLIGTNSYYNTPLFDYLQQKNYFVNNLQMKYFKLYKNTLTKDEIKILNLQYYKVDDIMLSIPCGIRNKTETINRMFKQSVPGFKTNKFNIVIKNINVNENDKIKLSDTLNKLLTNKIPVQTDINNIKFRFTK